MSAWFHQHPAKAAMIGAFVFLEAVVLVVARSVS